MVRRVASLGVVLLVLAVVGQGGATAAGPTNMRAVLSGSEEAPTPNDSKARGVALFQLSADGESLSYQLNVANIENVTQAHIHLGPPGVAGMIVVWLYPDASPPQLIPGRSQGPLATGTITEDDLVGPLAGDDLDELVAAIVAGNAYVNVHSSQFPPGEIRGQMFCNIP